MSWIQRYLHALGPYLPKHQKDDICAELAASLQDRLEEELANSDNSDVDAVEKSLVEKLGHPAIYASGFHERQALIRQPFLALYKQALIWLAWILFGVFCALELIASLYNNSFNPIGMLFHIIGNVLDSLVWGFAITTLIFFFAEDQLQHWGIFNSWNPEKLPAIQPAWNTISQSESAFGVVSYSIFAAWVLGWITPITYWNLAPSSDTSAALFETLTPIIGFIALLFAIHRFYLCFIPFWQRPSMVINILLNLATVAIIGLMMSLPSDQLLTFSGGKPETQEFLAHLSQTVRIMLAVVAGFSLYEIIRDVLRWSKLP